MPSPELGAGVKRREFIGLVGGAAAWPLAARAQSPNKVYRIGYLAPGSTPKSFLDGLITGLRDFGYIEGQNITIEWRMAAGQLQLLPAMSAELVQLNVDVIVASTVLAAVPARKATNSIPIIVLASHDGVGAGIYASLAHPGGNTTGIDSLSEVLDGKRIEILRQVLPRLSRLVVLYNPGYPSADKHFASVNLAARKFDISVRPVELRGPQDIEKALAEILSDGPDAVLSIADPIETLLRQQINATRRSFVSRSALGQLAEPPQLQSHTSSAALKSP